MPRLNFEARHAANRSFQRTPTPVGCDLLDAYHVSQCHIAP